MKITKEEIISIVNKLRKNLASYIGCEMQHDGWSCNSCFHSLDGNLKLKEDIHEYWLAVLFFRGDYNDFDWKPYDTSKYPGLIKELMEAIQ